MKIQIKTFNSLDLDDYSIQKIKTEYYDKNNSEKFLYVKM